MTVCYRDARRQSERIYTTDYVLDESFTLLYKRLPSAQAASFLHRIDEAIAQGYLQLEWISRARFEEAQSMRLKYQDKPDISFTDLTFMAIMQEHDISKVLTDDDHFTHVGMGFQNIP